jgi:hemoglobin
VKKEDIKSRDDIIRLITSFYEKVTADPLIGFIFNDIMKVNWEAHLPVMYDFWESQLLDEHKYTRNAMGVHFEVNRRIKLEESHFDRWLELFSSTLDELFTGDVAESAKKKARSIAAVMLFKMQQGDQGLTIRKEE